MRPSAWVHLLAAAATAASVAGWLATGAEGFTRWPDARLENADAPPVHGEAELLEEAGFMTQAEASAEPDIRSRFALGLVPGGADPAHLISVATCAAGAAIASGTAALARKRRRMPVPGAHP